MSVLGRLEEIVNKAIAAGEPALPRNLTTKVTVLLREQLTTQAEREHVVDEAIESFGRRYAAQLRSALERAAQDAPQPPPAPVLPPKAAPERTRNAPAAPRPKPTGGRSLTTRVVDAANRQLSRVPAGLRVTYAGTSGTIEPPGIVLDNGRSFEAPGPAAMWVNRGEPVNGWTAWKVADGRSLQECWDSGDWPEVSGDEPPDDAL